MSSDANGCGPFLWDALYAKSSPCRVGFRSEADLSPMPKLNRNALSAQMVRHAGPGSYVDGNGLMLRVRDSGSRSWVQRLMVHGRRVDIGLGNA